MHNNEQWQVDFVHALRTRCTDVLEQLHSGAVNFVRTV